MLLGTCMILSSNNHFTTIIYEMSNPRFLIVVVPQMFLKMGTNADFHELCCFYQHYLYNVPHKYLHYIYCWTYININTEEFCTLMANAQYSTRIPLAISLNRRKVTSVFLNHFRLFSTFRILLRMKEKSVCKSMAAYCFGYAFRSLRLRYQRFCGSNSLDRAVANSLIL